MGLIFLFVVCGLCTLLTPSMLVYIYCQRIEKFYADKIIENQNIIINNFKQLNTLN